MLIVQKWDFTGTWDLLQIFLKTLYFHYMRYRTDPITQIDKSGLEVKKSIFWRLIMLIMQNWDFTGTLDLLQMLLPILYLHNMRYRTDPMTQTW